MATLLLLLGLLVAPCLGGDGAVDPEPRIYASTPLEALQLEACLAHAHGDSAGVLDLLGALEARLLAGEGMEDAQAVSALALLGDTRLRTGDERGAAAAFRLMAGRLSADLLCAPCAPQTPPALAPTPAPVSEPPPVPRPQ